MRVDELRRRLDALYLQYDHRFVDPDPLQFVRGHADAADREVVGLIASSLAYGNVLQIKRSIGAALAGLGKRPAEAALHARVERLEPRGSILGALVDGQHARAARAAEIGGAAPGLAEAEHQHPLPRNAFHQRSFSVDKATSPKMADTIQKRTTIFCSGQPSFSKW